MKKSLLIFFFLFPVLCLHAQETEINGCHITSYCGNTTHDFSTYGNVYVVTNPAECVDLKVRIVNSEKEATYNVFKTTDTPKECGE